MSDALLPPSPLKHSVTLLFLPAPLLQGCEEDSPRLRDRLRIFFRNRFKSNEGFFFSFFFQGISVNELCCILPTNKQLTVQFPLSHPKEALELFRPDFISRSQGRLRRLEQRARRRRTLQESNPDLVQGLREDRGKLRRNCTTPDPLSGKHSSGALLCP